MGSKLMFSGLTAVICLPLFGANTTFVVAGAIVAIVGAILYDFDK